MELVSSCSRAGADDQWRPALPHTYYIDPTLTYFFKAVASFLMIVGAIWLCYLLDNWRLRR